MLTITCCCHGASSGLLFHATRLGVGGWEGLGKESCRLPHPCWDDLREQVGIEIAGPDIALFIIWKQNALPSKTFRERLSSLTETQPSFSRST